MQVKNKNEQIKLSLKKTLEKRQLQVCKMRICKVQKNKLNKEQKEALKMFFLEGKWYYNWCLSQEDIFKIDTKINTITKLDKDKNKIEYELKYLTAKMKQAILYRIQSSIKSLSSNKKIKRKVGKLKFKSQINCLILNQLGITHKLKGKYIKVNKIKKPIKLLGTEQIKGDIANVLLIQKTNNYYCYITTFENKTPRKPTNKAIGLDFGIKDTITTSNGDKYKFEFKETEKLKKYSKRLNRLELLRKKHNLKNSRKKMKYKLLLDKEYEKISNIKNETTNKFVNKLKEYDVVSIQDENLAGWRASKMKGWSCIVQHSIMGRIKSKIKQLETTIIVDKYFPSTKLCPCCGTINKIGLQNRIYECQCGYSFDRDTHSANNILLKGLQILLQQKNTMDCERKTSISKIYNDLRSKFMLDDQSSQVELSLGS